MTPTSVVSNVSRSPLAAQAAAESIAMPWPRRSSTTGDPAPSFPPASVTHAADDLLDPAKVTAIRNASTQAQQQSNFWFEISRIALWATTALIALTLMTFTAAAGSTLAAIPVAVPLLGVAAASTILIKSSQYSKRLFTDRMFDVQDFQMQRQAALIAKSVEKAVEPDAPGATARPSWAERTAASREDAAARTAVR